MDETKNDVRIAKEIFGDLGGAAALQELNVTGWNASYHGVRLLFGPPTYLIVDVRPKRSGRYQIVALNPGEKPRIVSDLAPQGLKTAIEGFLVPLRVV